MMMNYSRSLCVTAACMRSELSSRIIRCDGFDERYPVFRGFGGSRMREVADGGLLLW